MGATITIAAFGCGFVRRATNDEDIMRYLFWATLWSVFAMSVPRGSLIINDSLSASVPAIYLSVTGGALDGPPMRSAGQNHINGAGGDGGVVALDNGAIMVVSAAAPVRFYNRRLALVTSALNASTDTTRGAGTNYRGAFYTLHDDGLGANIGYYITKWSAGGQQQRQWSWAFGVEPTSPFIILFAVDPNDDWAYIGDEDTLYRYNLNTSTHEGTPFLTNQAGGTEEGVAGLGNGGKSTALAVLRNGRLLTAWVDGSPFVFFGNSLPYVALHEPAGTIVRRYSPTGATSSTIIAAVCAGLTDDTFWWAFGTVASATLRIQEINVSDGSIVTGHNFTMSALDQDLFDGAMGVATQDFASLVANAPVWSLKGLILGYQVLKGVKRGDHE